MMVAKHNAGHLIVLAAGGTGGHVFPAEALAQELLTQGHRLALVTDRRGAAYGGTLGMIETHRISAGALAGKGVVSRLGALASLAIGFFQARRLLADLHPSAVVGFGGYAAAPTVLAAINLGLPTIIHEQNAVLGRANRLLAGRVKKVCTSFDLARPAPEAATVVRTGMPVRPAIAAIHGQAYEDSGSGAPFRLLVLGGSQGARVFTDVIPAAIARMPDSLRRRLEISQQCRPEDIDRAMAAYEGLGVHVTLRHFFDNVPELLSTAHLVVARSGASTVAEVSVAGRPAILVPYPFAADDHQTANAKALAAAGGAALIPQPELTAKDMAARLAQLMAAPDILAEIAAASAAFSIPDAAARLAGVVAAVIRGENGARHSAKTTSASFGANPVKPGAV